ncbi:hypothetical protein J6590_013255 [Homalodisca vitripennis]|nr:hypothetical protein J6590_013255 [Homalodisca vitripennis]
MSEKSQTDIVGTQLLVATRGLWTDHRLTAPRRAIQAQGTVQNKTINRRKCSSRYACWMGGRAGPLVSVKVQDDRGQKSSCGLGRSLRIVTGLRRVTGASPPATD